MRPNGVEGSGGQASDSEDDALAVWLAGHSDEGRQQLVTSPLMSLDTQQKLPLPPSRSVNWGRP